MICKNPKCGHDQWNHSVEEVVHDDGDESLYFQECQLCDCGHFVYEEDNDDEEESTPTDQDN